MKTLQYEYDVFRHQGCPECGNVRLITDKDSGEIVCNNCGLVVTHQILDPEPEWRAYTYEERELRRRTGAPPLLRQFDKGLPTTFQPYRDALGKTLPLQDRLKMLRLRKWNSRARVNSSKERNLSQAMSELTRLSDILHLPKNIKENTAVIYRKVHKEGLLRGRSIRGMVAGALHVACRLNETPRSLTEIVEASTRSRKEISRYGRLILQELNMRLPIDDPENYIPKIASQVGLNQQTQNIAVELLQKGKQVKAIVGKAPRGIAAAALYIASKITHEKATQKELAKAAEVTEVTVRNRYKRLVRDVWSQRPRQLLAYPKQLP